MRIHFLIALALALATTVTAANALTVINSDKISHALMVRPQGGKAHRLVIRANHSGRYDCVKGCELMLGARKTHLDGKVEKVWIKDGKFVLA